MGHKKCCNGQEFSKINDRQQNRCKKPREYTRQDNPCVQTTEKCMVLRLLSNEDEGTVLKIGGKAH